MTADLCSTGAGGGHTSGSRVGSSYCRASAPLTPTFGLSLCRLASVPQISLMISYSCAMSCRACNTFQARIPRCTVISGQKSIKIQSRVKIMLTLCPGHCIAVTVLAHQQKLLNVQSSSHWDGWPNDLALKPAIQANTAGRTAMARSTSGLNIVRLSVTGTSVRSLVNIYERHNEEEPINCCTNTDHFIYTYGLQCFDAVGWAAGRASGL